MIDKNKIIKITFLILIVFFGLQLMSRGFMSLGSRFKGTILFRAASIIFPMDSKPRVRDSQVRLRQAKDNYQSIISGLQTTVHLNMLDHKAHFFLGSAYLSQPSLSDKDLRKGISSIHRAIRLKGGKDVIMNIHAVKFTIANWDRLEEKDRRLASRQLIKIISKINPETFQSIIETWETHCRDIDIFERTLEEAPQYFKAVADSMTRLQMNMKLRQVYMLNHEIHTLNSVRDRYRGLSPGSPNLLERLKELHKELEEQVPGYHKLMPGNKFKERHYKDVMMRLDFHILHRLFTGSQWKAQNHEQQEVLDFIIHIIHELELRNDLDELYQVLDRRSLFDLGHLKVHYIKNLIHLKMQDYGTIIRNLEELEPSLTVKQSPKDQARNQGELLLLLVDSYMSSRLLTKADSLLNRMQERFFDLPGLYLRKMRIQQVLGTNPIQSGETLNRYSHLYQGRKILVGEKRVEKYVYLIDNNIVEIRLDETFKEQIRDFHLLQVYVDGRIRHEVYTSEMALDEPILVKVTPFERFTKHIVRVDIIKIEKR